MTSAITNITWARDHQQRAVLDLELDGHPAHIQSCQDSELLRRGIVRGIVSLASERPDQLPNRFMRGDFGPELSPEALIGCTDDPRVVALHEEMCGAIRDNTWRPGVRSPAV